MSDLRRREGKLKILHTIIGDFGKTLRSIAENELVDAILTGTISPSKSYKETLTFQYFTDNGIKLLAKTTTAVQEIFIVTNSPDLLLDEMVKAGYLDEERQDVKHFKKNRKNSHRQSAFNEYQENEEAQDHSGNKGKRTKSSAANKDEDPLTLRQMLNKEDVTALMKLKEQMTKPKSSPDTRKPKQKPTTDEDDFAALFAPEEDKESFEEMFNRSKLDPKFFK